MKPRYRLRYLLPAVLLYGLLLRPSVAAQSFLLPKAAGTGAVPPVEVDLPEADRPPARTSRRAGARWTVSAIGGGVLGGATPGLEKAMTASGFGKSSTSCFFSCDSADSIDHPHSSGRAGWLLDVHREVAHREVEPYGEVQGTVGFLLSRTRGESFGYDGSTYLFITQRVTTFAPMFSLRGNAGIRLGLGPAWHRVGMQQTDAPEGEVRHQTRLGFVADFAVTFPARTRFYLDFRAQYRYVGSVEVGPYEVHRFGHNAVFPASRVGCSHGVFGGGVGMRL